jgi:hypothetical protein
MPKSPYCQLRPRFERILKMPGCPTAEIGARGSLVATVTSLSV